MAGSEVDIDTFIDYFRLLELAGSAEEIARQRTGSAEAQMWRGFAQAARNYHAWITTGDFDRVALLKVPDELAADHEGKFFTNVAAELTSWGPEESLRGSYLHFLGAFEAMNCLDGDRMMRELEAVVRRLDPTGDIESLNRARGYFAALESPSLAYELISSYEVMQIVADALGKILDLPKHPFEDIRRFALRPSFAMK